MLVSSHEHILLGLKEGSGVSRLGIMLCEGLLPEIACACAVVDIGIVRRSVGQVTHVIAAHIIAVHLGKCRGYVLCSGEDMKTWLVGWFS